MLDALKFVAGAVAKKDIVTELTHFRIHNRRITSFNGKLTLSCPIELDIDCCPKAEAMVQAIRACEETPQMKLTPTGKLSIRAGSFRTHVETIPEAFVGIEPEGQRVEVGAELLDAFRQLMPFVSDDASKIWANGVLLDGQSAFATNNVVLAEFWLGYHFPFRINIPGFSVREILRIGEAPEYMLLTASSATFFFSDDRWLKTQLYPTDWPDVTALLNALTQAQTPTPPDLFAALEKIKKFTGIFNAVYLGQFGVSTVQSVDDETGTAIEVPGIDHASAFALPMLALLDGIAERIDFAAWPAPVPWNGARIRGAIAGLRTA